MRKVVGKAKTVSGVKGKLKKPSGGKGGNIDAMISRYDKYRPNAKSVEKAKTHMDSSSGGSFIKLDYGETILRVLPPKNPEQSDCCWAVAARHYHRTSKDVRSIFCTGYENGCVACRAMKYLSEFVGTDEARGVAQNLSASERYYFSAMVVGTGEVGVLSACRTLATRIITPLSRLPSMISVIKGRNFCATRKKQASGFDSYNDSMYEPVDTPIVKPRLKKGASVDEKKAAISEAKKRILKILNSIPDLEKFSKPDSETVVSQFTEALGEVMNVSEMEAWESGNAEEDDASYVVEEDNVDALDDLDDEFDNLEEAEEEEEEEPSTSEDEEGEEEDVDNILFEEYE